MHSGGGGGGGNLSAPRITSFIQRINYAPAFDACAYTLYLSYAGTAVAPTIKYELYDNDLLGTKDKPRTGCVASRYSGNNESLSFFNAATGPNIKILGARFAWQDSDGIQISDFSEWIVPTYDTLSDECK